MSGKRKVGAKPIDRILWNYGRETVDEIVVHDCIFHIEQMADDSYWIGIYKGDDHLAINLHSTKPIRCRAEPAGPWHWDSDKEHSG